MACPLPALLIWRALPITDVFAVPEPSSIWLVGVGALALL
jgi:hypothetical protein